MKYCNKCGKELKEGTKFCTHCGAKIQDDSKKHKHKEVHSIHEKSAHKTDKPIRKSKSIKIFLILLALVVLLIMAKIFIFDSSPSSQNHKFTGPWHEPTAEYLNPNTTINFREQGLILVGTNDANTVYIRLTPMGKNQFDGLVDNNGVVKFFLVSYRTDESKLVFFSTLTKTSWHMRRVK
jgi:hypothetical protein